MVKNFLPSVCKQPYLIIYYLAVINDLDRKIPIPKIYYNNGFENYKVVIVSEEPLLIFAKLRLPKCAVFGTKYKKCFFRLFKRVKNLGLVVFRLSF